MGNGDEDLPFAERDPIDSDRALPSEIGGTRYRMMEQFAALGADFLILNDSGQHVFKIDGKSVEQADRIRFEDLDGNVLCEVPARMAHIRDELDIVGKKGNLLARIRRQSVSPMRDQFFIEIENEPALNVRGNVATHDYIIDGPAGPKATVSRRWFRSRGSYGVEIVSGQNDALLLAAIACMDQMVRGKA